MNEPIHKDYREDPGADMKETRGQGQGVGGPRQGDAGTDTCKCPSCGETITHQRGTPCNQTKCPKCGAAMVGA